MDQDNFKLMIGLICLFMALILCIAYQSFTQTYNKQQCIKSFNTCLNCTSSNIIDNNTITTCINIATKAAEIKKE